MKVVASLVGSIALILLGATSAIEFTDSLLVQREHADVGERLFWSRAVADLMAPLSAKPKPDRYERQDEGKVKFVDFAAFFRPHPIAFGAFR
jgi:hypothetical protein